VKKAAPGKGVKKGSNGAPMKEEEEELVDQNEVEKKEKEQEEKKKIDEEIKAQYRPKEYSPSEI